MEFHLSEQIKIMNKLNRTIDDKLEDIYRLQTLACHTTSNTENERVQSSMTGDKLSDIVDKIIELESDVDYLVDMYVDCKRRMIAGINQIENPLERDVLWRSYFDNQSLTQIALDIGCSRRWVCVVKRKALKSLNKTSKTQNIV